MIPGSASSADIALWCNVEGHLLEILGDRLGVADRFPLNRAIEGTKGFAASHGVVFAPPPADLDLVLGDENLLVRALHALLEAAVRFSAEGETVRLFSDVVLDSPRVIIESQGRTIPGPALAKFFDVFSIDEASTPGRDLGLGPALAHRILSLFGASVSVANRDPSGIRLTISLRNAAPSRGGPL